MLYYKIVEDKSGKQVKNYYLTQGDTFVNQLSITDKDGQEVEHSLISKVKFKLATTEYISEFEQEYEYDEEILKWTLNISSEDTKKWEINTHIYEYEITYINGIIDTPVQARFTVLNQIQEE